MTAQHSFDVIIIGGSYAGLSAAMALGRSLRKVLVIDNNTPCNASTPHSHNFLTQDGNPPGEIAARGRQQVQQYSTIRFHNGLAVKGQQTTNGFEIITQTGDRFNSKRLIFASGIKDQLPDIKGLAECWGKSVIHCPYCHGYEYRGQRTGIMANEDMAMHLAALVHNLTKDLVLLTNGKARFTDAQSSQLSRHQVRIIETAITGIEHQRGQITTVAFTDGTTIRLDALYVRAPFVQYTDIPASLGCELTAQGYIKIDNFQQTTVPGVFACGDNSSMLRSVANAVATGNVAGSAVNNELAAEQFG